VRLAAALLIATLLSPALARAQASAQMINLSCLEALTAIGQGRLTGVFSFVAEKDSVAAFSDMIARDKKALKKFVEKVEADKKQAGAISEWDGGVLKFTLSLFDSPLATTLDNPGKGTLARMAELSQTPMISLSELSSRRAAKR